MESQLATTADGQVVTLPIQGVGPGQVQMMQVNAGQVIQGANGQQIMVHAVPSSGQIQVGGAQGLQQIQVGTFLLFNNYVYYNPLKLLTLFILLEFYK